MSSGKQFTLHGGVIGPNPLKVAVVLEELGLEYDVVNINIQVGEQKNPEYLKLNPNGRVPALVDHSNGDFTIWESDAILLYLVENYDKEHKLSVADVNEKFKLIQWLFFQASGQGPYFGQAVWFMKYHQEKLPSAIERYQKEILRVLGVLESVLSKEEWLVGGKLTVADISFITWNEMAIGFGLQGVEGGNVEKEFPNVYKWHQKLVTRPVVRKFLDIQAEAFKKFSQPK
ncbi:glutathione S-transferase C-terminal-like protein [Trametes versicolor FP-101664 SS1]|uniref:glutathione S-transferase C-terminal-like protein n=1 Tax=Trametes versicolor (strain FP-101664) TaxID=717944 RepID=UPI0004624403|nr:glutathione S-transferase C-terminal-like protein [Trametes versicolor FP-101664 SS1]EIW55460.1 glutathione S-transferase C-terminal-like protein [Trametes versicolor FP-101664 SS1]